MHETSARAGALGRPRGMGGRWEGGSGWGTHVNPWLIHVNVWQKPLQYYKVISLQLINEKKERERRKWQPTPVFLPGGSQEQGSPVGCRLWGHTELDTTEAT